MNIARKLAEWQLYGKGFDELEQCQNKLPTGYEWKTKPSPQKIKSILRRQLTQKEWKKQKEIIAHRCSLEEVFFGRKVSKPLLSARVLITTPDRRLAKKYAFYLGRAVEVPALSRWPLTQKEMLNLSRLYERISRGESPTKGKLPKIIRIDSRRKKAVCELYKYFKSCLRSYYKMRTYNDVQPKTIVFLNNLVSHFFYGLKPRDVKKIVCAV